GCMNDVARLWSAGYALGASFENSVVFDEERLLNREGLRYADECARHKVLDVVGDLALAGLPLLGAYRSVRGGHKLNHAVLTALMADRSAWRVVESEPARRPRGRAELVRGMVGGMVAPWASAATATTRQAFELMSAQRMTLEQRTSGSARFGRRVRLVGLVVLAASLGGCGAGSLLDKFMAKDDTFKEEPADKLYNE